MHSKTAPATFELSVTIVLSHSAPGKMQFRNCDLPDPSHITAPENLEYMRKKQEQAAAKEARKVRCARGYIIIYVRHKVLMTSTE